MLYSQVHVVFTTFKMLGKIIDGSGLDKAFEEAQIYGNNTVEQIKDRTNKSIYVDVLGSPNLVFITIQKIRSVINRLPPIKIQNQLLNIKAGRKRTSRFTVQD